MYPDDTYRSFLLGTAEAATEAAVEAGILDGSIDLDHLCQIEEELIDDHLFGRLSTAEARVFQSKFLSTPDRAEKLTFARALQRYSAQDLPAVRRRSLFSKVRRLLITPWFLPLTAALSCTFLITLWVGERNLVLTRELAQSTNENNERQRVIVAMLEEQARRASESKASNESIASNAAAVAAIRNSEQPAVQPVFRLSPGISRGVAAVQVLHLSREARTVSIMLELPFAPVSTLHEELLSPEDKSIWSQQFSSAEGIANKGVTTIVLPAELFVTGEYRLRAEADLTGEGRGSTATYLFRVYKH